MIYLDNAATTQIHPEVLEEMMPYLKEHYGNAGTLYSLGRTSAGAVDKSRRRVASLINAEPEEIIFTSGGSEANSMVFNGVKDYLKAIGKTHIVVSAIEHDSVLKAAKNLIKDGFDITFLNVDSTGMIKWSMLEKLLKRGDVGLVSIMHANNEIGTENPVYLIGKLCREYDALFHTDCVQSLGSKVVNAKEIQCDFLSVSSHKIHGPKGIGALFVSKNLSSLDQGVFEPLIHGGIAQEFGLRGGTENVAGIVGFGKACEIIETNFGNLSAAVSFLRELFYSTLVSKFESYGVLEYFSANGDKKHNTGKVLNVRFEDVDAETLVLLLDARGICVSAGSACRSHESKPSHVLTGIGLTDDEARDSVRVSFSIFNTAEEVKYAAEVVSECVMTLGGHKWLRKQEM